MSRLKKTSQFLILSFILTNLFISSFLVINFFNKSYPNMNEEIPLDLEQFPSIYSEHEKSINSYLKLQEDSDVSIYDDKLNDFLFNLTLTQQENPDEIKIIIEFDEDVNKRERIELIDFVFEDYEIISNYDIISATYLKLNPLELLTVSSSLVDIKSMEKIYKSKIYQNPYILENDLQISALNKDSFQNWWIPAIGAENLPYDGTGVKVAIIDTGIYDHPDLNIIDNRNFVTDESSSNYDDDVGHGTHVGGIIGGDGSGSSGEYRGVAPGALLINARAFNASGGAEGDIINAIDWSSKPTGLGGAGADIVSMSFGGGYPVISDLITQAISNAKETYGVIFVASAGNSGPEYFTGSTPASGIDVISVGATNENDELAYFSSWGPTFSYLGYPDVVAPGVNIISAEAPNSIISNEERYIGDYFDFSGDADYIPLSGTSMSCPMVAGALAVIKEAFPNITPETARIALLEGAKKLTSEEDDEFLKSGLGIINVSASLNYLSTLLPNYNDTAKVFPDNLPVKPFDLLSFPGDHQKFNLTIISGKNNTYDIEIPTNIQGVSISSDKPFISFSNSEIGFIELEELEIKIDKDAIPGIRMFELNLSVAGEVYDTVEVTLNIRLPEYRILMDSYHGLNDWFPESSFYQMGFYEAMKDISEMNLSIDYSMEHWTPDYNKNTNNSILTEERLAQYDIVFLQAPILPYSPMEILNLKQYFDNGGNLLFLGTRYQDLVVDNINNLFSTLNTSIQINEENVMDDEWVGIGASVSSQDVVDFNDTQIFNNVNRFMWLYGNSFDVLDSAKAVATLDNKIVAAAYNRTSEEKGKFLAFGDLHWISTSYESTNYNQDHFNLLRNIIEYFIPSEEVSININLGSDRISNSQVDISIYLKNQTTGDPITNSSYNSLELIIMNESFTKSIKLNTTYSSNGIYFNDTFNLPSPSPFPYSITVNLTIGPKTYSKDTKILYIDRNQVPKIYDLSTDKTSITRAVGESIDLIAELDAPTNGDIQGYLTIFSDSFFNTKMSINKTITLSHDISNTYTNNFDPEFTDPSGQAIFYIIPANSTYTNPKSPRNFFRIKNNPPEILESSSYFSYGNNADISLDDTETSQGSYVYSVSQGTEFNFEVDVRDSVNYEDDNSNMRIFVNLFICSATDDGYLIFIFPSSYEVTELNYQYSSNKHEGSFTIPNTMQYSSITGIKSISTETDFNTNTNEGYLAILYISVYDSEGDIDEFIIILQISGELDLMQIFMILAIVIPIAALVVITIMMLLLLRRRKLKRFVPVQQEYFYQPSIEERKEPPGTREFQLARAAYCPYCGKFIKSIKKFCPHCGESLLVE